MNKRYMLPLIVLAILILLMVFRWDLQATKTLDDGVIKWKVDRWTGEVWGFLYTAYRGYDSGPIRPRDQNGVDKIRNITSALSITWVVLFAGATVWLVASIMAERKRYHASG